MRKVSARSRTGEEAKNTDSGDGPRAGSVVDVGSFSGRDIIVQFGLTSAPSTFRSLILRFLRAHLGAPEAPIPFGGRDAQIAELNLWLADAEAPSNLLVTAPAGRGKTSLLVRWLNQLDTQAWPVVFVPVSIRYGTNRAAIFYQALAARLADLLGEMLQTAPADPAEFYRDKVVEYLDLFHDSDRRCLIVMDGLDEAAGWQVDTSVLPLDPAPGLRIVASARQLAGDRGSTGWLRRLGWNKRGVLVRTLEVPLLDRDGIADVIEKIAGPLGSLAGKSDVLAELARLTAGEPLLIELYLMTLLERGDQALRLRLEDLRGLKPGFADFFRTWWEQQRQAWRDDKTAVDEQTVQAILAILACALGPVRLVELAFLLPRVHDAHQIISTDSLDPIRRFVIGDGVEVGYSFSHPKLAEHFRDEHFGGGQVIQKTRAAFVEWGRQTARALNEGRLAPSAQPEYAYLLEHYSLHLRQEGAPPELWMDLVEDGWRRSWEAIEGGYSGFAGDVQAAWDAVKKAQTADPLPSSLAAEIRCALCLSSLHSLGSNVPPGIIQTALAVGQLSWSQARHLAELEINSDKRARKFAAVLTAANLSAAQRSLLLDDALTAARAITSEWSRAEALVSLLPYLPSELLFAVFAEALAAVRAVADQQARIRRIWSLAPLLPPELLPAMLDEALTTQRAINDQEYPDTLRRHLVPHLPSELLASALMAARTINQSDRAAVLEYLAPQISSELLARALAAVRGAGHATHVVAGLQILAPHLSPELLSEALAVARAVDDEWCRTDALGSLVPLLPREQRSAVLAEALDAARAIEDESIRSGALGRLLPHFPLEQRADILAEACAVACALTNKKQRTDALEFLAPHLPLEMLADTLLTVRAISDEVGRSHALLALAQHLPPHQRSTVLGDALALARLIDDDWNRAHALQSIASQLSSEQSPTVLAEALAAAKSVSGSENRAKALSSLVPHLSLDQRLPMLTETLASVLTISDESSRAASLISLAPHLPTQLLIDACAVARTIDYEWHRANVLGTLALNLPPAQRRIVFAEALLAARAIEDVGHRTVALETLARRLLQKQRPLVFAESIAAARDLYDDRRRATVLGSLAQYLLPEVRPLVFAEALAVARAIGDTGLRADALLTLAQHLPAKQRPPVFTEVLAAARSTGDQKQRAAVLGSIATHLLPEQRPALLSEALAAAHSICEDRDRIDALVSLAAHLPPDQRPDILAVCLAAASAISDQSACAAAIVSLAPHLPPELLARALVAARTINDEQSRYNALLGLAPHLPPELSATLIGCITQHLANLRRALQ